MERNKPDYEELSFKDKLVLRIISELIVLKSGTPPSYREILKRLSDEKKYLEYLEELPSLSSESISKNALFEDFGARSTSVIRLSLNNLQDAGFIEFGTNKDRTIVVLNQGKMPLVLSQDEIKALMSKDNINSVQEETNQPDH